MDRNTLQKMILRWARRDFFNGVGRIFLDEFSKAYGVTEQEVVSTLKEMGCEFQVLGDIIKIKMEEAPGDT